MPFALPEFFDLALHWQAGIFARFFKRLPSEHFIIQAQKNGVILNTVQLQDKQPAVCRICGFALASIKIGDAWLLETCSHYGMRALIDNSGRKSLWFDKWVRQLDQLAAQATRATMAKKNSKEDVLLTINIISFGYKSGPPPEANMLFDMRFLDNPYWVEDLRPLTGQDKRVQEYVLKQQLAQHFLTSFLAIIDMVLAPTKERGHDNYTIAFGCTGGQHRSVSLAEHVAKILKEKLPEPDHIIKISHREIADKQVPTEQRVELATKEQQP